MRSAASGGLIGMENTNDKPRRAEKARVRTRERESRLADVPATISLQTARANAYTAPMQRPATTKVYSVSLPVLAVWSQWSNVSRMGQSRQISRDAVATNCEGLERTDRSISLQSRIRALSSVPNQIANNRNKRVPILSTRPNSTSRQVNVGKYDDGSALIFLDSSFNSLVYSD